MAEEIRVYPAACTSAYCGKTDCGDCGLKPMLDEFKAWRKETEAVQPDYVWSPRIWKATK